MQFDSFIWFWIIVFVKSDGRRTIGNLNLFSSFEIIPGEPSWQCFYVRDGILNMHAVNFEQTISFEDDYIYFNWSSPKIPVFYDLKTKSADKDIVATPEFSGLSYKGRGIGMISTNEEQFKIEVKCKQMALSNKTVEVTIFFNMSTDVNDRTRYVHFKLIRVKECFRSSKSHQKQNMKAMRDALQFYMNRTHSDRYTDNVGVSTSIFYISVGISCCIIFTIAITVAFYHVRSFRPKLQRMQNPLYKEITPTVMNVVDNRNFSQQKLYTGPPMRMGQAPSTYSYDTAAFDGYPTSMRDPEYLMDPHHYLRELTISPNRVTLVDLLQEGTFGKVYRGYMVTSQVSSGRSDVPPTEVFIKTVNEHASDEQTKKMLTESSYFHHIDHRHILPLIAVVDRSDKPPMTLFPFTANGNLKLYLKQLNDNHQNLSTKDVVSMAHQITKAMQYLSKKKLTHRDLATRNCVVDEEMSVKVTDSALSRDLFAADYQCLGDNINRPVRWLAPESLLDYEYSPESDAWSFGVTLWELVSCAQQPYVEVDPFEMAAHLKQGYRLAQPHNCPDELFRLMVCCWTIDPNERPKFIKLSQYLADFHKTLGAFI